MGLARSPLAPLSSPELAPLDGVHIAAVQTGMRYKGRLDLLLMQFAPHTSVAGVFTQSRTAAAPVDACRAALKGGVASALLVNAGNANAFTGERGISAVTYCTQQVAAVLECDESAIFLSSTGVIGQPLNSEKLCSFLPALREQLGKGSWQDAAEAIRTTDTFAKVAQRESVIGDTKVRIQGIAKGSGMIAPNMATMLAYVATDAAIGQAVLQDLLNEAVAVSFNCITVDSDTSTNDTLLVFATGKAGNVLPSTLQDPDFQIFREAFTSLLMELAQLVVRDGEGAQKFIAVRLSGAESDKSAHIMAMAIANSPPIKTAIAGEDPNWGRVVMAIGKTGEPVDQRAISIAFGDFVIARSGSVIEGYDETPVAAYMKGRDIVISVEVGHGKGAATVWTCDLTHGYIDINADYRS